VGRPPRPRAFDHVLVLMFENQYRAYVKGNSYFARLARAGVELTNSFGVMHPSQTNYIASVAGELCNVTSDDRPGPLAQRTIVDLVEEAGLEWKAYMDGFSAAANAWAPGFAPQDAYPYVIKHDPFSSFAAVTSSEARWQRVVSEAQLWTDVRAGSLPAYCWFTPDMWNDGHYIRGTTSEPAVRAPELVDQAAGWLEWFFGTLRFPGPDSLLPPRTLVVVTFDESDFEAAFDAGDKYTYDGPNQIYTVLLGDVVRAGTREAEGYNHYSLLRTIEENFGLGTLGKNDADSNWMRFLWGERFAWGSVSETPLTGDGSLAAAGTQDGALHIVEAGETGLEHRTWTAGAGWSEADAALSSTGTAPALVARPGHPLLTLLLGPGGSVEADGMQLVASGADALAVSECERGDGVMLVYRLTADGSLWSRRLRAGSWEEPVGTGRTTRGAFALTAVGHVLLLVHAEEDGSLACSTYGTAAFNAVTVPAGQWAGPYDDATVDAWSPDAFPVAHFGAAAMKTTPGEREPAMRPYGTGGALALAQLDGVVHLVHPRRRGGELLGTTYSIAGVLTSKLPVTYNASDEVTTSDGYGTLAEAGWSTEQTVGGADLRVGPDGALAACRVGPDAVVVLAQAGAGEPVRMVVGRYESD
jgi:hypothetical protein